MRTLGFLFEGLVERDLRTYAESFGAELYHYQDYENHEIDAVVELSDGRWAAIEVKLGVNQEESAAAGLKKIAAQMSAGGCAPSAAEIAFSCDGSPAITVKLPANATRGIVQSPHPLAVPAGASVIRWALVSGGPDFQIVGLQLK